MLFQRPPGVVFCIKRACTASVDETVIAIMPPDVIADKVPAIFSAFYVDSFAGIRVSCNNHFVFHDFLPFLRPICYNRGSGGAVSRYPVFTSFFVMPPMLRPSGIFYFSKALTRSSASSFVSDFSMMVSIALISTSVTVCISFSILRSFLSWAVSLAVTTHYLVRDKKSIYSFTKSVCAICPVREIIKV